MSATNQNQSPLDSEPYFSFVKHCIEVGDFNTTIATKLYKEFDLVTSRDSIRRFRERHDIAIPGVKKAYCRITGDVAEAQTEPIGYIRDMHEAPKLGDPDSLLIERGLDPDLWYIPDGPGGGMVFNHWDGPQKDGNVVRYYQLKFRAQRRRPEASLLPPRPEGYKPPTIQRIPVANDPKLIMVVGDHQAPFHDPRLHDLTLQWLEANQPDEGVHLGDLMDFPDISRHPDDPDNVAAANECLQSGYGILADYRTASPVTHFKLMPGNHDERLRKFVIEKARPLHGLKRADTPDAYGEVVHDISYLLRLDELGIEFIDPKGSYELAQVTLGQNLAVRHGWIVRQKGGESAYQSLQKCGYSILVGHTHRQAIVQHTLKEITGKPRQLLAAEIGCMCRLDPGPGVDNRIFPSYAPMPDWQMGFATVSLWPDGKFNVDLATYVNGVLMWSGQRYE